MSHPAICTKCGMPNGCNAREIPMKARCEWCCQEYYNDEGYTD